jgi:hypothetical protein
MKHMKTNEWCPTIHRGRFEMSICTRAFFHEQHSLYLATPYASEIRGDDGKILFVHFRSQGALADFVSEMAPTDIEITGAIGESVAEVTALIQGALDAVRNEANEVASSAIARASGKPLPGADENN